MRCATLLCLAAAVLADETASIEWSPGLAEAKQASARDGRPVLLYFTFDT